MSGRFTRPVMPGDTLVVSIWLPEEAGDDKAGDTALFQTATEDGQVVIDRGTMRFLAPGATAVAE
jgi:acyl dehydratase